VSYDESAEHEPTWGTSFDAHNPDKQIFVDPRDAHLFCDHGVLYDDCEICGSWGECEDKESEATL
jgi:hypothetical protein